ncbi:hypothetical protein LTR56_004050 [Elasticomyces elasticus]|nr:hypothetical protein LTR56_004050 [Elasticomyces elasticus]KAK3661388.1 hypothetical protein LTR22_007595 [Elasticomyces elasticus]KAK4928916.1 hypothetical protein LTR49_004417 [Elasticomyces elasticus]
MTKRTADRAAAGLATTPTPEVLEQDRPKKKSRRMKVLSTPKLSAQQKQIYESNRSNSPLLRLAPEIRNRIFSILLGEKTIHISSYTTKGSPVVMHSIYQEAALLPYQLNNFMCPGTEWLGPFLQTLVPAQAYAIENLTFSNISTHNTLTFQNLVKVKLKGLKHLTCFVEFSHNRQYQCVPGDTDKSDSITLSLLQLKSPTLVTASAVPYKNDDDDHWWGSDPPPITRESMRTWAGAVETALLTPET